MADLRFPLCVIPAAGLGTRMGEHCTTTPKCLLDINGQPILWHIIRYWERYCPAFAVVVRPQDVLAVRDSLFDMPGRRDDLVVQVVAQPPERTGVNEAILTGLRFMCVPEHFLVVLGDCLFDGKLDGYRFDPGQHHGIVTMEGDTDCARSYSVNVEDGDVVELVEKPRMGCGAYFLRWTVVRALERRMGITAAVSMLAEQECVREIPFTGRYLNVTYPEDLRRWA